MPQEGRMSDQPIIPTPADVAPKPAEPVTPTEPAAAAPVAPEPTDTPKSNVWDNPETAKAEIERLRRENGAARTNAKQAAADEARQELANTIGKALGLVKDEPADPTKLTEQAAQSAAEAKQARVELAVFRNAAAAGADPQALLDSASFLAKVRDVDPTDTAAVSAAISEAVASNPRLGAATTPTIVTPAPNPAQGTSSGGTAQPSQLTKSDIARMSPEDIDKAISDGRFNNLLAGQ